MKKNLLVMVSMLCFAFIANAQKVTKSTWHYYSLGGEKNYFVKNTSFTNTQMKETNKGGGVSFDKMKTEVEVAAIEPTKMGEIVITKYDDTSYYAIYFQNLTSQSAKVYTSDAAFKTAEDAKLYTPEYEKETGTVWYTKTGFAAAEKKKVMPEMQKKDVLAFVKYFADVVNELKQKLDERTFNNDDEKAGAGMGMVLMMTALPSKYAEQKGFHAYKSIAVIDKAMKKFKNDKDVKKILETVKLD